MDPKCNKCIFLEYANRVKGYYLWDPTTPKIVINKDVIFIENQLQKKDRDDSTIKETSEIVLVYVQNNLKNEDSSSSEEAPKHEEQEPVKLQNR